MDIAIHTQGLSKSYKDNVAVAPLDLDIYQGEIFALLGPNGAGKTTTIKMLSCLIKPTSGDASIYGKSILSQEFEVKKLIAVSPQETAVARNLTALENLQMVASICGKSKEEARALADKFGLLRQPKLKAKNLSGGNQRRLSIAMAIITGPKVIFLDEPTLGLDIEARRDLWDIIRELKKTCTIILTTHYLEEADALSDRIGIIKDGKLVELSTSKELKTKYAKGKKKASLEDIYMQIIRGGQDNAKM